MDEAGGAWGTVEVGTVTVDGLAARYGRPDVVIVDVEGFEGEVLDGAVTTIGNRDAVFLVEVHVNHGLSCPPEHIVARFSAGYALEVAPVEEDEDAFETYTICSTVVRNRFFLLAAPD